MIENHESSIPLKIYGDIFQIPLTRVKTFIKGPFIASGPPTSVCERALSLYKLFWCTNPQQLDRIQKNNLSS